MTLVPLVGAAQAPGDSVHDAWQIALEKTRAGQHLEAIGDLVALDRRLREDGASAEVGQLVRYYVLYNLAQAGRFAEVRSRRGIVRADELPQAFRTDLVRLEAEAALETGDPQGARDLLAGIRPRTGRMDLLYGRALAALDQPLTARDAIAQGLIAGDDATGREKRAAAAALVGVLEAEGRLAEAETLRRILVQVYGQGDP